VDRRKGKPSEKRVPLARVEEVCGCTKNCISISTSSISRRS
jgi:hypothetical protein